MAVHTVACGVVDEVPLARRKFLIPKQLLDLRWRVAQECAPHKFQTAIYHVHVFCRSISIHSSEEFVGSGTRRLRHPFEYSNLCVEVTSRRHPGNPPLHGLTL